MSKRQSSKREPNRQEPEVDLEPIRKVYDVVTDVLKLGRRWLKSRPLPGAVIGHPTGFNGMPMLSTFMHAVSTQLFPFRAMYLQSDPIQTFISKMRPLSDAIEYLELAIAGVYGGYSNALLPVAEMSAWIDKLENARDILGDELDNLEADETPRDLERRTRHSLTANELRPSEGRLRDRLELILAAFDDHGPGPFRWKKVATLADLPPDSHLRSDLSVLKSLGYLRNEGQGYTRTDKSYPMS
jgi:hypothetical protein